jgi:hypothetical protein
LPRNESMMLAQAVMLPKANRTGMAIPDRHDRYA